MVSLTFKIRIEAILNSDKSKKKQIQTFSLPSNRICQVFTSPGPTALLTTQARFRVCIHSVPLSTCEHNCMLFGFAASRKHHLQPREDLRSARTQKKEHRDKCGAVQCLCEREKWPSHFQDFPNVDPRWSSAKLINMHTAHVTKMKVK